MPEPYLEVLGNLADEALERQLADEQLRGLLVLANFAQRHGAGSVAVGLRHAAAGATSGAAGGGRCRPGGAPESPPWEGAKGAAEGRPSACTESRAASGARHCCARDFAPRCPSPPLWNWGAHHHQVFRSALQRPSLQPRLGAATPPNAQKEARGWMQGGASIWLNSLRTPGDLRARCLVRAI